MASESARSPDISVVIPVYEDPSGVRRTLQSVTDQTASASTYEVIVVDNGSGDATPTVVREFERAAPDLVTLVVEDEVRGSYAARNAGIARAVGDVVAFVDADMTVERSWVEAVVETMTEDVDYVGFDVELVESTPNSVVDAYNRYTEFPVERYLTEDNFAPTCCLAVRREVFEAVGPFDDRLCSSGDAEFGKRVHEAGFDQQYEPSITMYHPTRSTRELLAKYVRIGRGLRQRERYHSELFDRRPLWHPKQLVPTVSPFQLHDSAREVQAESDRQVRLHELLVFYCLDHLIRVATFAGRMYEWLCDRETQAEVAPVEKTS
ncbi:glycosyltransferase [Halomicroarcula sp. F13]|uniref:Glycosyltransferase n=1 Tax=Haloarcula rubra TaxID=2487747 RepID=A0AAW4PV18_9EURY|nr:glycosyltransferase [Halomicroarcula rubra]MBX0324345.1 glycosyltransferase [Halomicroarcula rubra]